MLPENVVPFAGRCDVNVSASELGPGPRLAIQEPVRRGNRGLRSDRGSLREWGLFSKIAGLSFSDSFENPEINFSLDPAFTSRIKTHGPWESAFMNV